MPEIGTTQDCRKHLDRSFASSGDTKMQKAAMKTLRFLAARDEPMQGKTEGWATGIVCADRDYTPLGRASWATS